MASFLVEQAASLRRRLWSCWPGTFFQPPGPPQRTGQAIFLGPLVVGSLAAFALIAPPQAREVYVAMRSEGGSLATAFGIFGILWLSASIYAWNAVLMQKRMDARFEDQPSLMVDSWLKRVRDLKSMISAGLPLVGLVFGFIAAVPALREAEAHVRGIQDVLADPLLANRLDVIWRQLMWSAVFTTVLGGIGLALLLHWRVSAVMPAVHRASKITALAVYAVPFAGASTIVWLAQTTGPLFVISLFFIVLIPTLQVAVGFFRYVVFGSIVAALTLLTRLFGVYLVGIVCFFAAGAFIYAKFNTYRRVPEPSEIPRVVRLNEPTPPGQGIEEQFDLWLINRGVTENNFKADRAPFPVFVLAAQGGGIYAAASSMGFLAGIQDRCDRFQNQIFTISAISGGALGSAVFRGLASEIPADAPCGRDKKALATAVNAISTTDHLSGLVLATPLDWVSKLPALFGRFVGLQIGSQTAWREEVLKQSFVDSYGTRAFGPLKEAGLTQLVADYWTPKSTGPGLVLGLTSVETANRIAFSPFSLTWVGDGTLQSMNDLNNMLRLDQRSIAKLKSHSIIDAAIGSARFPGVLPAWSIAHTGRRGTDDTSQRRLNFVDGGYADSSGATTALEIVSRLKDHVTARSEKEPWLVRAVELHVIILTDSETTRQLSNVHGTGLPDTLAPLTALFNARMLAAGNALQGAFGEFHRRGVRVHKIVLDHDVFELPLGWFLSRASNDILQLMLGTPEGCSERTTIPEFSLNQATRRHFQEVVHANSCAQRDIVDLLRRR